MTQNDHVWLRCAIGESEAWACVPRTMADAFAQMLEPFVAVEPKGDAHPASAWRVRIPAPGDGIGGEPVDVTPSGEPPTTLGYEAAERTLWVDPGLPEDFRRQVAARYIRVLLRLQTLVRHGEVFVHGGLAEVAGRGVAVMGDKRAGKTSTILSLLERGSALVSNDDVSFAITGSAIAATGWPRAISVRRDTFGALGIDLAALLHQKGIALTHPANGTADRYLPDDEQQTGVALFYPQELVRLFNTDIVRRSTLDALVFPQFTDVDKPALLALDPHRAATLFERHCVANPVKYSDFLLPAFGIDRAPDFTAAARAVAERVPAFELRQRFDQLHQGADLIVRAVENLT